MNIQFFEDIKTFKLDSGNSSYIIKAADDEGFLGHVYYGAKIEDCDLGYLLRMKEYPFTPASNARERCSFMDLFPHEYSGWCSGDFRESAIEVKDGDCGEAVQFFYKSHKIYAGKPKLEGLPATFAGSEDCMTLEITVEDPVLNLEAVLMYSVFADSNAITRSVRVANCGSKTLYLNKIMSSCIDMDAEDFELMTLHGSWARERHIERRKICYGIQRMSSTRGATSHQEQPFIGLVSRDASQENGRVYGFHFVYSGNFMAQVGKNQFDSLRVLLGIHPEHFCFKLEKGCCFQAPEVVMVFSDCGIGGMSRTYHDLYRNHLIRSAYKDRQRPILINNWEATYFDFNTDKLLSIAREAKKCGIEMLVMDDGWFGKRNDDNSSLGDWTVNESKLPGGLSRLVDEVNKIGLKFGIWFEPEMISPDSDLYRQHPDWAISIDGRTPCRSRNQLVLDLSRRDVVDHVYESVASVLRSANIEYVKWDMNRQLTDIPNGEIMHRYVLAVYELQERLLKEFPNLLLENCTGGGGRFDPGMLYFSPQIWCSDDTDAIERLSIQEGTELLYPLSTMGAHISDCPNHVVGRVTPFETRGHVALAGTFGYELDITKIPESDRNQIPAQVEMYHKYNDLVRNGDYYRIASYSENHVYDCWEVVSKDKKEALVTYVQVVCIPNCHSKLVRIPGLASDKCYRVTGYDNVFRGDTLSKAGILVEWMKGDFCSRLIHIEQVSEAK